MGHMSVVASSLLKSTKNNIKMGGDMNASITAEGITWRHYGM